MEISDVQKFLLDNHRGVLVARKRDGSPQITLVTPTVDANGHVIISSRATTYKVKNIRRDPRVSLLVMGEQFSGSKYYQIEGRAEVIPLPEAMDGLVEFYQRTRGRNMSEEEARKKISEEQRALIRIDIEKVGPQGRG
jgi:PPOX class probable F420-dependent enzyme